MSVVLAPADYDALNDLLTPLPSAASAADVHGFLSGRVAAGGLLSAEALHSVLEEHLEIGSLAPDLLAALTALAVLTQRQLADIGEGFAPYLPDDDTALSIRLEALALWSQSFLVGFGSVASERSLAALSENAQEALRDMVSLSHLDPEQEQDIDDEEDAEADYMTLFEHLRLSALLLFGELNAMLQSAGPTRH